MGCCKGPKSIYSAKQNAERLHGASSLENIPCIVPFHCAASNTTMVSKNVKRKPRRRSRKAGNGGLQKPPQANANSVAKQEQSIGRSLIRSLARMGGGILGGTPGMAVGDKLGNDFAKYIGFGDYKISKNSIVSNGMVPAMHSTNNNAVIRHREFIADVVTSSTAKTFAISSYAINPGQDLSYPWLAAVARNYQEYSIRGMVYHFQSTAGDSINTTDLSLGTVIMATQYRAGAPAFTDKLSMLNEYFSGDGRPCDSFAHAIECNPKENPFQIQYVRVGGVPTGEDIKMYDIGTFSIATSGFQGTSVNIGELWCTYEIELRKPQLPSQSLGADEIAMYTGSTAISGAAPMGTPVASILKNIDNIGLGVTTNSVGFPFGAVGAYKMSVYWLGATVVAYNNPVPTNCTLQFIGTSGTQQERTTSAVTVGAYHGWIVNIPDPGKQASVTFTETTVTGATVAVLEVARVLPGYWT